jgi:hypothetical protein
MQTNNNTEGGKMSKQMQDAKEYRMGVAEVELRLAVQSFRAITGTTWVKTEVLAAAAERVSNAVRDVARSRAAGDEVAVGY